MKVLIAIDSFKGSLTSQEAGDAIADGIKTVSASSTTKVIPIADGGEGTVNAILGVVEGKRISSEVTSPLGNKITADFAMLGGDVAVIEMAAASGLTLVEPKDRNPLITSTYGTGELIKAALDKGTKKIVIGIGGSATNDGGAGMAEALGVRFLDKSGKPLKRGGGSLGELAQVDVSALDKRLKEIEIEVMCDVDNPLCGPKGASHVYGPQKGATNEMVTKLDNNLAHFADVIKTQLQIDIKEVPGAGAAGGLGGGLLAFTGAKLKSGIEAILGLVNFDELVKQHDIVITGEGRIDQQSLHGKVPYGVASRAQAHNIPCVALAGSIAVDQAELEKCGIQAALPIVNGPISLEEAMVNATELTKEAAVRMFSLIKVGRILR